MNKSYHIVNKHGFQAARLAVLLLISLLALGKSISVVANERTHDQSHANNMRKQVEQTVMQYLQAQTQGYPGKVNIALQPLDSRIQIQPCEQLEAFSMQGSRLWGKAHVGVRCRTNANQSPNQKTWSLYLQADIQVFGQYAVTSVPVSQGQVLTASDIVMQTGDLSRLPNGILTDANQVAGKLASINLTAGTVLRPELLKASTVVQQGQTVQLTSAGNGFVVSTDGTAMNTAQSGQVVQVKVASGLMIKGIAKDSGKVEVGY